MAKKQLNKNLHSAKTQKQDEFYTQIADIERELKHYKDHFNGKTIFCNCDDPRVSNFFRYFSLNFKKLGLKKLITTCYKNQDTNLFSVHDSESAVYLEYTGDQDPDKVEEYIKPLVGDGDFRSEESIELLKQSDIVITNPPFSLFREYVAQLMDYEKKFIIVGSYNTITYREIFKLIKENRLWLGYGFSGGNAYFKTPHAKEFAHGVYDKDTDLVKFRNVTWFTNLDIQKRHEKIILLKKYFGSEHEFSKYDNFDAINIDKIKDIPIDYQGAMGVPITFMDKYNPDQFEIIDAIGRYSMIDGPTNETRGNYLTKVNGIPKFARIVIKRKDNEY